MFHGPAIDGTMLQMMRRGRWEHRTCPVEQALRSAYDLYGEKNDFKSYEAMPDRCMLFARKFDEDALERLRELGKACGANGLALDPKCADQNEGVIR